MATAPLFIETFVDPLLPPYLFVRMSITLMHFIKTAARIELFMHFPFSEF